MHGGLTVTTKADHMDQFRSEMLTIDALSYLAVLHIKTGEVSAKREGKKEEFFGTNICSKFSFKLWHDSNVSLFHTKTIKSTHCHHINISTSQKWSQCCRRELDIAGYVGNQGEMVTPEQCKEVDYQNFTT